MADDKIYIERILVKDLPALAASAVDGAAPGTFIPITKHRAEAHVHNPLLQPGDVGLLLAKEGERNVGYFGMMPVMLQYQGKQQRVFWLTTWAVAPGLVGRGLGSRLMQAAVDVGVDLAIVGSKPARRVSAKFGFHEVASLNYVQIDFGKPMGYNPFSLLLRIARKLLAAAKVRLPIEKLDRACIRAFEWLLAPLMRPLWRLMLNVPLSGEARGTRMQAVDRVQPVESPDAGHNGFVRSVEVINWMLAHPWVLPSGRSESEALDFEFTDARPGFKVSGYRAVSLHGVEAGFVCFQSSRIRKHTVLKVLDYQFAQFAPPDLLLALTLQEARRLNADVIEGPAELVQPIGGGILESLLVHKKQRTLQVHPASEDSLMAKAWPHIRQTYVDGDMAFT